MKEEKKKEKKKIPVYQIHRSTYVDTHARLVLDFIVLPAALGIDGTIFASIGRIRILNNLCMEMHSLTLIILTTNCPVVCAVKKQHCGDREKNCLDNQFFSTQNPFRVEHFRYIQNVIIDVGQWEKSNLFQI